MARYNSNYTIFDFKCTYYLINKSRGINKYFTDVNNYYLKLINEQIIILGV